MSSLATRLAALIVAALLCWPPAVAPAAAEEAAFTQVPRLFGTFRPEQGVWSEYAVVDKASGHKSRMRMSVVGKEGDSFWYEVVQDDGKSRNVIKMLVRGDPNEPENIERLILKSGDEPAREMPKDFVAMGRKMAVHMFERHSGVPAQGIGDLKLDKSAEREVKVAAGTFVAAQHRIVEKDGKVLATYDFTPSVLPFGVVTSQTESVTMELLSHGRDARSTITETPVRMSTPPGMPEGMPRGMPPGMNRKN